MLNEPTLFHLTCACMAVSNMGHEPDYDRLRFPLKGWKPGCARIGLSAAVCLMAEQYMETEEHQEIFEDEASAWRNRLQELTWEEAISQYPRVAEIRYACLGDG